MQTLRPPMQHLFNHLQIARHENVCDNRNRRGLEGAEWWLTPVVHSPRLGPERRRFQNHTQKGADGWVLINEANAAGP
jgi:hypothetical protein